MKKKLVLMCIAGALVMTAVIGGTLAGFNTSTENKGVTDISVNTLSIDVTGAGMNDGSSSEDMILEAAAAPGGEVEVNRTITNDGDYALYTRVTVNKKWDADLPADTINMGIDESTDWIVFAQNDEQIIMYYTKPLEKGETVTIPINKISFDAKLNNDYAGKSVEFAAKVDAVQAAAAEDSMPSEWGVYPSINADGIITAIEE